MIRVRRNVQHVFDPIFAIWHLYFIPVYAFVLEATVPIEPKAKNIAIQVVFRCYVPYDESGVKHAAADLVERNLVVGRGERPLDKGDAILFGVAHFKVRRPTCSIGNCSNSDATGQEVAAHFDHVVGRESDFGQPILRRM